MLYLQDLAAHDALKDYRIYSAVLPPTTVHIKHQLVLAAAPLRLSFGQVNLHACSRPSDDARPDRTSFASHECRYRSQVGKRSALCPCSAAPPTWNRKAQEEP